MLNLDLQTHADNLDKLPDLHGNRCHVFVLDDFCDRALPDRLLSGHLPRAIAGEVHDVAVDLRRGSPGFGQWYGVRLSPEKRLQGWAPEGFTHGFVVLSDYTELLYKTKDYWAPKDKRRFAWNDPQLAIDRQLEAAAPATSAKDAQGLSLHRAETFP